MVETEAAGATRGRVLVVDDEPHIRRILTTLLERSNLTVDTASDGTGALDKLRGATPYGAVVMDLMMPGATGLDVLRHLPALDHRKGLPVLILTAKGEDADREAALAAGARGFLTKPFSPKKLLAQIHQLLEPAE